MPWGLFRKKEADSAPALSVPAIGAFGKIPQMGDFVRAGGRLIPSFEKWLEEGMAGGEKRHREAWPRLYAAGMTCAFTFRPPAPEKDGSVLMGVLKPSRDSVGRKFPLVLFGRYPEKQAAAAPHLLPLLFEPFAIAAKRAMQEGEKATSASDFQKHLDPLHAPLPGLDHVEGRYDIWSYGTSLNAFWLMIYGDEQSLAPLHALKSIREAVAPFSHQENSTTQVGVRLPLGGGGIAAAAFWLDVIRRIAHWRSTTPTCFWSLEGPAPSILIQLGATPPSSLAELWSPDSDSQCICDLTVSPGFVDRVDLLRALPRELATGFERSKTLSDLLDVVAR
jgi:type VI secretion system protein ImpM